MTKLKIHLTNNSIIDIELEEYRAQDLLRKFYNNNPTIDIREDIEDHSYTKYINTSHIITIEEIREDDDK